MDARSSTLAPGLRHMFSFTVPETKTVPALYPEAGDFQAMPKVFATGFMVGLMEWTCIQLLAPHLKAGEGSLGTHIDVSHLAATPPALTVTVEAELTKIEGRRVWFDVSARDDRDLIGAGRHERAIVAWSKFEARVADKLKTVLNG